MSFASSKAFSVSLLGLDPVISKGILEYGLRINHSTKPY